MDELVTTVVVARDRVDDLARSLSRHRGRVLLVDDGSRDGTAEWVRRHRPAVEVLRLPSPLGVLARNVGVRAAPTPYVALAEADSWWDPGALELAAMYLETHERLALAVADLVTGPDETLHPASLAGDAPAEPDLPGRPAVTFPPGAVVLRRSAFLAVGGFGPLSLRLNPEQRLCRDVTDHGWGAVHLPLLTTRQHVPDPGPARSTGGAWWRRRVAH